MQKLQTDIKIYTYFWQIGDYFITIHTTNSKLKNPFYNIYSKGNSITKNINSLTNTIPIELWLEKNVTKKDEILSFCKKSAIHFIPKELECFYESLNYELGKSYCFSEHVNRYYKFNNYIFAHFPYPSDNFILQYSYDNNKIILYGNENNLYRILLDFLTISQDYLPLHASAIKKGDKAICLVSDSGCGKTSLLIQLLKRGYSFIADDSVFANDKEIFRISNLLTVRRDFPNHPKIMKIVKKHKEEKIVINIEQIAKIETSSTSFEKVSFFLLDNKNNLWNGLEKMTEPFPCISHHSFWCMFYLVKNNQKEWLDEKIKNSIIFWNQKLQHIKPLTVNLKYFESYVENFAKEMGKVV